MKTFILEESFPCSVLIYFQIIYEKPDFKQKFHVERGDIDVEISEWIEQGPPSNSHQRICFYSMVEKNTNNSTPEISRCLETERYEWQKDQKAEAKVLQVYSSVTPENSLGNIFKISANWMVSPINENECKVWLEVEVECTKRIWGLQNIAEGYLETMVSDSMKNWFKKAHATVLMECEKQTKLNKEKKEELSNVNTNEDDNKISLQNIRMRSIGDIHTVVSGTNKLVQMLSQNTWKKPQELDEEELQGLNENYLSHFVVETPHLHADNDLDANGVPISGKIRIPSSYIFSVLFIILVILLVYWYTNYSVII